MLKSMYMYNVHFTKKYRKMVKQNFASMLPDIIFQDRSSRYNDVWYVKKIIAQNSFCRWIVWSNWTSKCDLKKCKKLFKDGFWIMSKKFQYYDQSLTLKEESSFWAT